MHSIVAALGMHEFTTKDSTNLDLADTLGFLKAPGLGPSTEPSCKSISSL